MDDTSFDIDKELERVIRIIFRKLDHGLASDVELQTLPQLIRARASFLVCSCDPAKVDAFELALKED